MTGVISLSSISDLWELHDSSGFQFSQLDHLQRLVQGTPLWKHSQYFFRHWLFLQLQPLVCLPVGSFTDSVFWIFGAPLKAILGLNAVGFLSLVFLIASSLFGFPGMLSQSTQLQSLHPRPDVKQSQYNLMHFEFFQLHFGLSPKFSLWLMASFGFSMPTIVRRLSILEASRGLLTYSVTEHHWSKWSHIPESVFQWIVAV